VRPLAILFLALLTACESAPPPPPRDATKEAWYGQSVEQLAALSREAEAAFATGKPDQAAALIEKGQPLMARVLTVAQPTLEATIAAADLDQLYGRMLLSNRHYGWARLQFQKNLARWKHWQPPTADRARRLQQAEDAIAECDRHIVE
jgi:crotonobetainyl-CoA:carnitine CoA-transferase CaiB-like acyl-CoA transferase